VIQEIAIIIDGLVDEPTKSEFAVIFGNTVNEDGSLSERLTARLEKGIDLYKNDMVEKVVVSGGLGKEGYYEATEMQKYLLLKGIPKQDILVDNAGNNTWLTAQNFKKKYPDTASIIVVSQFYHIKRAKLAFYKSGYKKITGVHADYYELRDAYSLFREFFGYYKYLLVY